MAAVTVTLFGLCVISNLWTWLRAWQRGHAARAADGGRPADVTRWPTVTVLVPAWREQGTVDACIQGLNRLEYPAAWGVVVIAGGPDETFDVARQASDGYDPAGTRFRVIQQPPAGKNAALNLGMKQADGEVIVILDADSVIDDPDWLRKLVAPLAAGSADAVSGSYAAQRATAISDIEHMMHLSAYRIHGSVTLQGSGGIALKRVVVDNLGGFDETVPVGVDWDLNNRVARLGTRRAHASQAHLRTERPANLDEFWHNEVRWRRAHMALLWSQRAQFFSSILGGLSHVSFYIVTLVNTAVLVVVLAVIPLWLITGWGGLPYLLLLCGVFFLWITGRHAALVGETVAYTGERRWWRHVVLLNVLLFLTMAASWWAAFTHRQLSMHFKGPRQRTVMPG